MLPLLDVREISHVLVSPGELREPTLTFPELSTSISEPYTSELIHKSTLTFKPRAIPAKQASTALATLSANTDCRNLTERWGQKRPLVSVLPSSHTRPERTLLSNEGTPKLRTVRLTYDILQVANRFYGALPMADEPEGEIPLRLR